MCDITHFLFRCICYVSLYSYAKFSKTCFFWLVCKSIISVGVLLFKKVYARLIFGKVY